MLLLVQRWSHDTEYSFYRSYESQYTDFLIYEINKAVDEYFKYIKMKDSEEKDYCEKCLTTQHYLLLLQHLVAIEKQRNQKFNVFAEMWRYNCFYRTSCDIYEALGVGLLDESIGNLEQAQKVLESVVKRNPINDEAIRVLKDFYKRNPGLNSKN